MSPSHCYFSKLRISSSSGNRPSSFFEKMSLPSAFTSNTPPLEAISSSVIEKCFFNCSTKLVALGLYFQALQYSISSFIIRSCFSVVF